MQQWHVYIDLCFFAIFVFWSGMYAALKALFFFLWGKITNMFPGRLEFAEEGERNPSEKDDWFNCTIQGFKWYPKRDHLSQMGEHFVF